MRERGGRLYVWTSAHRCCTGPLVLLETGSEPPKGAGAGLPRLRRRRLRGAARHGRAAPAGRARARAPGQAPQGRRLLERPGLGGLRSYRGRSPPAPAALALPLPSRHASAYRASSQMRAERRGGGMIASDSVLVQLGLGGGHRRARLHLLRPRVLAVPAAPPHAPAGLGYRPVPLRRGRRHGGLVRELRLLERHASTASTSSSPRRWSASSAWARFTSWRASASGATTTSSSWSPAWWSSSSGPSRPTSTWPSSCPASPSAGRRSVRA